MLIQALDKALDVLLLLHKNRKEMGISDIARALSMQKSTVHRILQTLQHKGFVSKNVENDKYWLGVRLYSIGMTFGETLSNKKIIKPYADRLQEEFNEVVNVSTLDSSTEDKPYSVIILKSEGSNQILKVNPFEGSSSECHGSSVGKCLLAFNSELDFEIYKKTPLTKYNANTITDWDNFLEHLKEVREQGYAIDNEELEIGLTCIGAPILNRKNIAVAAISLSGPTQRMRDGDWEARIRRVKETAAKISENFK